MVKLTGKKTQHRKGLAAIYRQEIIQEVTLFTSQSAAVFYDKLFSSLDFTLSHCVVRVPAQPEGGARSHLSQGLLRLAACGWLPGLPQATGEYPGGGLLGTRQAKV